MDPEVEAPEEIFEECSVREEEEAWFWDMSLGKEKGSGFKNNLISKK